MDAQRGRRAFTQATEFYIATVGRIPANSWDGPGLGVWSVRDLVGHTSRSLLTVEAYLERAAEGPTIPDAAAYFVTALETYGNQDDVAQRGRDAGAALGPDPLAAIQTIAARILPLVAARADDASVGTIVGGMRLGDYLPTRVFELGVHTLDLAAALGLEADPPIDVLAVCLQVASALAERRGLGSTVLMALSGRRPLPGSFSLL